jgi:hypothetical protein
MAHLASFDAHRWMLKSERTALVRMTLQTGFLIAECLRNERRSRRHAPRRRKRAMWIMAIRALHEARIHGVFKGHRKIGANIGVTSVAEFRLRLGKEKFGSLRFMDRMALRAGHVIQGVGRVADICARERVGVTTQACIQHLLGRELRKGNNGRLASVRGNMRLTGSMATFASGIGRRFFPRGDALEMSIFVKPEPDVRVAGLANHASDVSVLRRVRG